MRDSETLRLGQTLSHSLLFGKNLPTRHLGWAGLQTTKTAINAKSTSSLLVPNALFNELIVAAMQESEQRFFRNVSVKDRKRRIPITPVILDILV